MKIGVDIMGGDFAPSATVKGAILAAKTLSNDHKLVLIGDRDKIESICRAENFDSSVFEIIHTTETIEMSDYPAKAFSQKPNASIVIGFKLLSTGKIEG